MRRLLLIALVVGLPGCAGEIGALTAIAFSMTFAAWWVGRDRQRRALYEAEVMRHAITNGEHRHLEQRLRQELALVEAGEAVSDERQWLARAQLGGLLVAEWRLDEAKEIYGVENVEKLSPHLKALAAFGRHEVALLTDAPTQDRLDEIRRDRDECLQHVPSVFRRDVEKAWHAVEGLCLVRMDRPHDAAKLLEDGIRALEYNPALVVYLFHLGQAYERTGEHSLAAARYTDAMRAFPGTRLASEAASRARALGAGQGGDGTFRGMLPEAPVAERSTALAVVTGTEPEDD